MLMSAFESLMGFPMRCDVTVISDNAAPFFMVSIPYGCSNALRLGAYCANQYSPGFQSLMGFPMRCDAGLGDFNTTCRSFNRSEEHTSELQSLAYLVCR